MRIKVWVSILLCIKLLAGCSYQGEATQTPQENGKETLGLTPDFSYEIELQTPNILVNQIGYLPQSSKVAVLQGRELESAYYVYDAATDWEVMQGELKEAGSIDYQEEPESGTQDEHEEAVASRTLYLADFSQLEKEGTYYIFHENLGYSDPFSIKEDIYAPLEEHILDQLLVENENTSALCHQLATLLFTLELYPDKIGNPADFQAILEEKIALLILAQDSETGSVYEKIPGTDGISLAATAEFAGVMAMYARYVQPTDRALANQYQNMAQAAYKSITDSLDNVSYDAGYFAASQLFRLTGWNTYAQAIGQYLMMEEGQKSYTEYDFTVFADYGYLSGTYGINMEWSRQLMNKVREQAAAISQASNRGNYFISTDREHYDTDGMLKDMAVMALVNYIITNHEYTTLQKHYLDYFLGRNPEAGCMVEGFGTRNISGEQTEGINSHNAALFYLLLQSTK